MKWNHIIKPDVINRADKAPVRGQGLGFRFAIPFSSGPHSVRPLHHDPSVLGGPTWHGLVSLS